ncbi:hypothetical protein D3C76_1104670 [compost metagenome]
MQAADTRCIQYPTDGCKEDDDEKTGNQGCEGFPDRWRNAVRQFDDKIPLNDKPENFGCDNPDDNRDE